MKKSMSVLWMVAAVCFLVVACGDEGTKCPVMGSKGNPCYGNGTCDGALVCLSNVCVDPTETPDIDTVKPDNASDDIQPDETIDTVVPDNAIDDILPDETVDTEQTDIDVDGGAIPTSGLIGEWLFNGNANDTSGTANNGTVHGATLTTDRFGVENKAYEFDGSNFIKLNDCPLEKGTQTPITFAVSFWTYTDAAAQTKEGAIFFQTTTDEWYDNIAIFVDKVNMVGFDVFPPSYGYIGNDDCKLSAGAWTHYVVVRDNGNMDIYKNGILVLSSSAGETYTPGAGYGSDFGLPGWDDYNIIKAYIGGMDNPNGSNYNWYFNGKLDDLRIYNSAILLSEIQSLYHENGWN